MVCDALMAAEPVMRISEMIQQPVEYLHLDDGVLRDIYRSKDEVCEPPPKEI